MAKNDNKRERILAAALNLFTTQGFSQTKIIDIANAANVGKGTVYQYFSSKNQLFEALFCEKIMDTCNHLKSILSQSNSVSDKLLEYITFEYNTAKEMDINPHLLYNLMTDFKQTGAASTLASLHQLLSRRFEILYEIISEGIKSGEFVPVDPVVATAAVIGAINTYLFLSLDLFSDIHREIYPLLYRYGKLPGHEEFCNILLNGLTDKSSRERGCA